MPVIQKSSSSLFASIDIRESNHVVSITGNFTLFGPRVSARTFAEKRSRSRLTAETRASGLFADVLPFQRRFLKSALTAGQPCPFSRVKAKQIANRKKQDFEMSTPADVIGKTS